MKKALFDNISWTAYRKDVEQSISNERLWLMGAGDDAYLHEKNIEELTEELENIIEGNYQMVIDKYENMMGKDSTVDHFIDYMIEDPEKVVLQAESQRNELFLDALTDIALQTGWEHVEFEDSKMRSITLRSWANEFADKYAGADWGKLDYITTVDDFAAQKVTAYLNVHPEMIKGQEPAPAEQKVSATFFSDVVTYTGLNNEDKFIYCNINGIRQSSKKLSEEDTKRLNEVVESVRQSKNWGESRAFHLELAGKYFIDEVRQLGMEISQHKGMKP